MFYVMCIYTYICVALNASQTIWHMDIISICGTPYSYVLMLQDWCIENFWFLKNRFLYSYIDFYVNTSRKARRFSAVHSFREFLWQLGITKAMDQQFWKSPLLKTGNRELCHGKEWLLSMIYINPWCHRIHWDLIIKN